MIIMSIFTKTLKCSSHSYFKIFEINQPFENGLDLSKTTPLQNENIHLVTNTKRVTKLHSNFNMDSDGLPIVGPGIDYTKVIKIYCFIPISALKDKGVVLFFTVSGV